MAPQPSLDVITIGRSSVDLYGQQIGSRLEDITSFAKSVGGCPANIAIGTARLGLKSGLITRVGNEQMGRFIKEQMAREGVALDGIVTDPSRLTALVLLSVENDKTFPADLLSRELRRCGACPKTISSEDYVASARAVLVTGTHFAKPNTDAAQRKAMRIAAKHGRKVVFDIDYRPNLWGLAGHAAGEERYIKSDRVSEHLQIGPAGLRPHRRHGRRGAYRSGSETLLEALRDHPQVEQGGDRLEARADGLRRVSGCDPGADRRRHCRTRFPDRGL